MVLVTMQVRVKAWDPFHDALAWLVEIGRPPGLTRMQVYRGQSDPHEVLWVCEMDTLESWETWAARLGEEFHQRAATADLTWADRFWVPAQDAPAF